MNSERPQKSNEFSKAALNALEDFEKEEAEYQNEREYFISTRKKKGKTWFVCKWILLIFCTAIIIFQAPKLISSLSKSKQPLRHGTYATDKLTDQCITNLWHISSLIQKGNLQQIINLVCPASKKPYLVVKTEEDIVVRSPSPELYGFKDIRVSKKKPLPELIK